MSVERAHGNSLGPGSFRNLLPVGPEALPVDFRLSQPNRFLMVKPIRTGFPVTCSPKHLDGVPRSSY